MRKKKNTLNETRIQPFMMSRKILFCDKGKKGETHQCKGRFSFIILHSKDHRRRYVSRSFNLHRKIYTTNKENK